MWAIGLSFMIMGSVPYWVKRLNGQQHPMAIPTYKNMFRCGIWILILWFFSLFIPEPYSIVLPVLPVLVLGIWTIGFIQRLMDRIEKV